jgi:hypothetical protein
MITYHWIRRNVLPFMQWKYSITVSLRSRINSSQNLPSALKKIRHWRERVGLGGILIWALLVFQASTKWHSPFSSFILPPFALTQTMRVPSRAANDTDGTKFPRFIHFQFNFDKIPYFYQINTTNLINTSLTLALYWGLKSGHVSCITYPSSGSTTRMQVWWLYQWRTQESFLGVGVTPEIFSGADSTNSVEDRGQRERESGAVAP